MARNLHHCGAAIHIAHLAHQTLHLVGLRSGARRGEFPRTNDIAHRADQPARPLSHVEQVFEQESHRRLAIGAGHPRRLQLQRGMTVESRRRGGQRRARICHADHRGARDLKITGGDDGGRAFFHRLKDEIRPARHSITRAPGRHAGERDEESAGPDLPRIMGQSRDLSVGRTGYFDRLGPEGGNDFAQQHAASVHVGSEGHQRDRRAVGHVGFRHQLKMPRHSLANPGKDRGRHRATVVVRPGRARVVD